MTDTETKLGDSYRKIRLLEGQLKGLHTYYNLKLESIRKDFAKYRGNMKEIKAQNHTIEEVIDILKSGEPVSFSDRQSIELLRKWLYNWSRARTAISQTKCLLHEDYDEPKENL